MTKTTTVRKRQQIENIFLKAKDVKQMHGLLSDLFTPQELLMLEERIEIFRGLKKGEPQRSIAERLGCSIATVTRGSREYQFGSGVIGKLLSTER